MENTDEFYSWYLSKFYQNIIEPSQVSQFEFESIYKLVSKNKELKFINFLLEITDSSYNYNPIFVLILSLGYSWFDDITQRVLKKCKSLADMSDLEKSNILDKLCCNSKPLDFNTWNKIIKILLQSNFNIQKNNSDSRWFCQNLIHIC